MGLPRESERESLLGKLSFIRLCRKYRIYGQPTKRGQVSKLHQNFILHSPSFYHNSFPHCEQQTTKHRRVPSLRSQSTTTNTVPSFPLLASPSLSLSHSHCRRRHQLDPPSPSPSPSLSHRSLPLLPFLSHQLSVIIFQIKLYFLEFLITD